MIQQKAVNSRLTYNAIGTLQWCGLCYHRRSYDWLVL